MSLYKRSEEDEEEDENYYRDYSDPEDFYDVVGECRSAGHIYWNTTLGVHTCYCGAIIYIDETAIDWRKSQIEELKTIWMDEFILSEELG